MEKEKDILEKHEDITLGKEMDSSESIEEHYAKMYKDLPPDVVKMLISTHPLYGDKAEELKDEIEKTKEPVKEIIKSSTEVKVTEETKKIDIEPVKDKLSAESKSQAKVVKLKEDNIEDNPDEEKEFLYSLFSDDKEGKDINKFKRNIIICILTSIFLVCIIGMVVNIIQSNKNKTLAETLKTEKQDLVEKLNNLEIEKQKIDSENEDLNGENESLKNQLVDSTQKIEEETQLPSKESIVSESTKSTENIKPTIQTQTHKVAKGETLWKISEKMYGTGKYYTDIMKANNIAKDSDVKEGMVLTIPAIQGGK